MPWPKAAWCISTASIGRGGPLARTSSFGHGRWEGFCSRSFAADRCASLRDHARCRVRSVEVHHSAQCSCTHDLRLWLDTWICEHSTCR